MRFCFRDSAKYFRGFAKSDQTFRIKENRSQITATIGLTDKSIGFAQQNTGKKPVKPETFITVATRQTCRKLGFNQLSPGLQFRPRFIKLPKLMRGHSANDVRCRDACGRV